MPESPPHHETEPRVPVTQSPGFWAEVWSRFRKQKLAMTALLFVGLLAILGIFSPAIVGTKPIVCDYKGGLYFPAMGYFRESWENPIFITDGVIYNYPQKLKEKDPHSWAIWPLIYQDPLRRVRAGEIDGYSGNPIGMAGKPSRHNLFGTNDLGEDVFAKMIHGTRIALLIGFVSTGIAAVIGIAIGAIAGFFGGWVDWFLSRIIEVMMCIPTLVLILALISIIEKPTIWHLMVVIGAFGWTGIARLTRAEFLKLRQLEYVAAARALGFRWSRLMFRHILPNALAPVIVPITFGIAAAILLETTLGFLGIGAPDKTSWGRLLNEGKENLQMWWLIVFPGTAIFLTVLAYNLIGEGIQQSTDPTLKASKH
ncbi:MAG: ABC transporter permease [Pirellulales bacterium]|nr:ABC transporter permease [Pirellulales bacterium]